MSNINTAITEKVSALQISRGIDTFFELQDSALAVSSGRGVQDNSKRHGLTFKCPFGKDAKRTLASSQSVYCFRGPAIQQQKFGLIRGKRRIMVSKVEGVIRNLGFETPSFGWIKKAAKRPLIRCKRWWIKQFATVIKSCPCLFCYDESSV